MSRHLGTYAWLLLSVPISLTAAQLDSADQANAYAYLNTLRQRAGMILLGAQTQLQTAAENHADYLADNRISSHYERDTDPGFTGVYPVDRAIYAGYASRFVSEDFAGGYYLGSGTSEESLDGLMGAIYHRFDLLGFDYSEIGAGVSKEAVSSVQTLAFYVFNPGNQQRRLLCESASNAASFDSMTGVCADTRLSVSSQDWQNAIITTRGNNPLIVQWPASGDTDFPPAFYEESPDPLPDYSVSGNPISLAFNPLSYSSVTLHQFKLYRGDTGAEVTNVRLMDASNDPNSRFSGLEFALFPLERLEWNTPYRAVAQYTANNQTATLDWNFRTRNPAMPVYTINGNGETVTVAPGQNAIYIRPSSGQDEINGNYRVSYDTGMAFELVNWLDNHTLVFNINGSDGQRANVTFSDGRSFTALLNSSATTDSSSNTGNTNSGNDSSTSTDFTAATPLANISTRALVENGQNNAIAGFIITGSGQLRVLIKAAGRSLQQLGLNTQLDPQIQLYRMNSDGSSTLLTSNDDWASDSNASNIPNSYQPLHTLDSALLLELDPGAYTAVVAPADGVSGIGLVSVDAFSISGSSAQLSNISTRALVGNGDNGEIAGFIINASNSQKMLIKAAGRSLQSAGINTNLNPALTLYDMSNGGTVMASNDDWQSDASSSQISSAYQPADAQDAALLRSLGAGAYTGIVVPADGVSGVGLISVDLFN